MKTGIIYEIEDEVGVLRVNRPEARNALDFAAQRRFAALVESAHAAPPRALIITGTGPAFSSGADLKELAADPSQAAGERLHAIMSEALARLTALPVPVIAAINGDATGGGCEILTACDLRLMAAEASLRFVQTSMGLTTGWGGAARLVALLGRSRALELLLTGRAVAAAEAATMGLVHRVVPANADVLSAAQKWAAELCALPTEALAAMKALVYAAADGEATRQKEHERALFTSLFGHENHREAMNAFLDKRPPQFHGKGERTGPDQRLG